MAYKYHGIYTDFSFGVHCEQAETTEQRLVTGLSLEDAQEVFKEKLSAYDGYVSLTVTFETPSITKIFDLVCRLDNRIRYIDDDTDEMERIRTTYAIMASEPIVWRNDLDLLHYNSDEFENASWQRHYTKPKNRMIVVDTETTGFIAGVDELLQVSIINSVGETLYNSYIKPTQHTEWNEVQAVNGITPEAVANAPTIEQEIGKINRILKNAEVYVGYNSSLDMDFLSAAGAAFPEEMKIRDVMKDFAPIYGEWNEAKGSYKLQKLIKCAAHYGYDWSNDKAHDSLSDCRATLYCFDRIETDRKLSIAAALVGCDKKELDRINYNYQKVLCDLIPIYDYQKDPDTYDLKSCKYAVTEIGNGLINNSYEIRERLDLFLSGKPFPDDEYHKGVQNYRKLREDGGYVLAVSPLQYAHWKKNDYGRGLDNGNYNESKEEALKSYIQRVGRETFSANEMQRYSDGTLDDRISTLYEYANDRFCAALTFKTPAERDSKSIVKAFGKHGSLPDFAKAESRDYDNMLSYFIYQQGHDISEVHEALIKNPNGFPDGEIFAENIRFVGTVADEIANDLSDEPSLTLLVNVSGIEISAILRNSKNNGLAPLVFDRDTTVCLFSEKEGKGGPTGIVPDKEIWIPGEYLAGVQVMGADLPADRISIEKAYCLSRSAFKQSFKYVYGDDTGRTTISDKDIEILDKLQGAVKNTDAARLAEKAKAVEENTHTITNVNTAGRR